MDKKLPARPNLEHLRRQAKALLAQLNEGDLVAAQTFVDHLPAAKEMTFEQVQGAGFRLADAQSAIARETGFATWPALAHHVEQLREFEGTWAFSDLEVDGTAVPTEALGNSRMLMDGDRFRMESPEGNYEGIFSIDVEQNPHHLDIEFVEGPEAGNWAYGIYELSGDHLKICLGLVGSPRPEAFATLPGSGHALENLVRVTKARPEGVEGGTPQPAEIEAPKGDPAEFEVPMTPLIESLQGEWLPVELVRDGQALPGHMLSMGLRTMTGNETKVIFGGQTMVHAKVKFDESASPIAVDYLNQNGTVTLGVMDFVGQDVRFCMGAAGAPRPDDFSCETGSGRILSVWRKR